MMVVGNLQCQYSKVVQVMLNGSTRYSVYLLLVMFFFFIFFQAFSEHREMTSRVVAAGWVGKNDDDVLIVLVEVPLLKDTPHHETLQFSPSSVS